MVSQNTSRTSSALSRLTVISTANEEFVGKAIRDSGIPRSEFFVVTKLPNTHHSKVEAALDASLSALGLDYVDLYLMHWPQTHDETGGLFSPS